jgi:diguanylate cyclase (GGDEF)-like protein
MPDGRPRLHRHAPPRPIPGANSRRGPKQALAIAVAAMATAGAVALAGGGEAFWLCLPVALALSAYGNTPRIGALGAMTSVAAAFVPSLASGGRIAAPASIPVAILVPAASVAVLIVIRERLTGERDALRISALTDPLTGVANRRSLVSRTEYEISRHRRARRPFALLMLDLDGFKLLNDRFGHAAGDDLLIEMAAAVQSAVRDQDTVARIGGDEFCVLAPETDAAGARKLAIRVMTAVGQVTAGVDSLGASPGLAVFPHDGATVEALLAAADEQLLAVKRRRHGRATRRAA